MFTGKLTLAMHLSIKNLGIVQSAEIELNGLTVLTGHNDTGKSFIGKLIFSIIYTLREAESYNNEYRIAHIRPQLGNIEQYYRTILPFNTERRQRYLSISEALINKISEFIRYDERYKELDGYKEIKEDVDEELKAFLDLYEISIETDIAESKDEITQPADVVEANKTKIKEGINALRKDIYETIDKETIFKNYFNSVIVSEMFQGQINPVFDEFATLEVKLIQGSTMLLSLTVENNSAIQFDYKNEIFLTDATIIETPTLIQLDKYFFRSAIRAKKNRVATFRNELPVHYTDLLSKFTDTEDSSPIPLISYPEIFEQISPIIGGELIFSENEKTIFFLKNDKKIASSNIATGIKSFGILQLLLKSGNINKDSFLIIDEPEVHLHPHWEIEYARLLVLLSKAGVPIIISTHSPYFLRALRKYCKEDEAIEKLTKFYFGEKKQGSIESVFTDVTEDPEPIFKALAEPMMMLS